ncbi:MAG: peptidylprolyl isomerase [Anaerosomatales bacterium]|nr:peptidylprolyl isomerase [Anaerosomatales bacterium]
MRPVQRVVMVCVTAVALGALVGCGADRTSSGSRVDTSTVDGATAGDADAFTGFEEVAMHESDVTVGGEERALVSTDKGVFVIEFFPDDAPNHVASFIELAEEGFYDGVKVHRVEPGFVVQAGDPQTRDLSGDDVRRIVAQQSRGIREPGTPALGTGGPGWNLPAEFNSRPHLDGTVAMARSSDPDSAGSQFYICLGAQPFLDGKYTVFGTVIEGMDVVRSLAIGDTLQSVAIEGRP